MRRLDDAGKADIAEQRSSASRPRAARRRRARTTASGNSGMSSPRSSRFVAALSINTRRPACACRYTGGWRSRTAPGSARPRRPARETPAARHRTRPAPAGRTARCASAEHAAAGLAERQRDLGQFALHARVGQVVAALGERLADKPLAARIDVDRERLETLLVDRGERLQPGDDADIVLGRASAEKDRDTGFIPARHPVPQSPQPDPEAMHRPGSSQRAITRRRRQYHRAGQRLGRTHEARDRPRPRRRSGRVSTMTVEFAGGRAAARVGAWLGAHARNMLPLAQAMPRGGALGAARSARLRRLAAAARRLGHRGLRRRRRGMARRRGRHGRVCGSGTRSAPASGCSWRRATRSWSTACS